MKKILSLSLLMVLGCALFFAQKSEGQPVRPPRNSPSYVVAQLYSVYMNRNFRMALDFTMGREKKRVQDILGAMNRNFGRPPQDIALFLSKIHEMRIIDEKVVDDKYAQVDVIWVLRIRDKDNSQQFQVKVNEVAYLLEKQKKGWMIRDTKFIKQHVLYDYSAVQEKYKQSLPFSPQEEK